MKYGRVRIELNGEAGKEKIHQQYPELLGVAHHLVHYPNQSQYKGQEEIGVAALVAQLVRRQVFLASNAHRIKSTDPTDPVSVAVVPALNIVLAPDEVPHKVAHVHVPKLEIKHIAQVVAQAGFLHVYILSKGAEEIDILIGTDVARGFHALKTPDGVEQLSVFLWTHRLSIRINDFESGLDLVVQAPKVAHVVFSIGVAPHPW